jgi:predicted transposase/invertase (TIGR01784 family)
VAIAIIELITRPKQDMPQLVQNLKRQDLNRDIVELIETVLFYKFTNLSRQEIETMFALSDLKKTKVYQEALQEGELRGELKGELKLQKVARNLLEIGMNVTQVAKVTGLTVTQVQQLQN